MLDPTTGVEVVIRQFGSIGDPYSEYVAPLGAQIEGDGDIDRYIAAVTDERFTVDVILPLEFDFRGAQAVRVEVGVYAGGIASDTGEKWVIDSYIFEKDVDRTGPYRFQARSFVAKDYGSNSHSTYGFSFGRIPVDDSNQSSRSTKRLLSADTGDRGKITIMVVPGKPGSKYRPGKDTEIVTPSIEQLSTTSAIAVGRGRSHVLKPVNLGRLDQVQAVQGFNSIRKSPLCAFTFCYVSQQYLEDNNFVRIAPDDANSAPLSAASTPIPIRSANFQPSTTQKDTASKLSNENTDSLSQYVQQDIQQYDPKMGKETVSSKAPLIERNLSIATPQRDIISATPDQSYRTAVERHSLLAPEGDTTLQDDTTIRGDIISQDDTTMQDAIDNPQQPVPAPPVVQARDHTADYLQQPVAAPPAVQGTSNAASTLQQPATVPKVVQAMENTVTNDSAKERKRLILTKKRDAANAEAEAAEARQKAALIDVELMELDD